MSRFLQFWCILNTHEIVKTFPFRFVRDYYGDFFDVMFPQFPKHFPPFPVVFLYVSPSVSTISLGLTTLSPQRFRCFLF